MSLMGRTFIGPGTPTRILDRIVDTAFAPIINRPHLSIVRLGTKLCAMDIADEQHIKARLALRGCSKTDPIRMQTNKLCRFTALITHQRFSGLFLTGFAVLFFLHCVISSGQLQAAPIDVPNASFESPQTDFVDTRLDFWQKTPKPAWWDENSYGPWDQLVGSFANVAPEDPRHIDNCHGNQAIWVFANPGVGLFQDYESSDWSGPNPRHAFDARFDVGKGYELTVGVFVGVAYPMAEGATLELSLYYRNASGNRVTVAATVITNSPATFQPDMHHLIDFKVNMGPVASGDPWAGQHIGIAITSTVSQMAGGYWVVDNVRLYEVSPPVLAGSVKTNGLFGFNIVSEPGRELEILSANEADAPLSQWVSLGTATNLTGTVFFSEPLSTQRQRFYRAREVP